MKELLDRLISEANAMAGKLDGDARFAAHVRELTTSIAMLNTAILQREEYKLDGNN